MSLAPSVPRVKQLQEVCKTASDMDSRTTSTGRRRRHAEEWHGLSPDLLIEIFNSMSARELLRLRRLSVHTRHAATRALECVLGLSPEQVSAFCDAVSGKNVFLSGGAGAFQTLKPCPISWTAWHRLLATQASAKATR